jgi:mannose-6-phosphate isomerase class I
VLLCTDGAAQLRTGSEQVALRRGQAVFVAAGTPVVFEGEATVFCGVVQ